MADEEIHKGTFRFHDVGGIKGVYLYKGILNCGKGPYEGQLREGEFALIENKKMKEVRILLKKGKLTFSRGDVWEGEFDNFRWFDKGEEKQGMFTFKGKVIRLVSAGGGDGAKEEVEEENGVWDCVNTGREYYIQTYLGELDTWEEKKPVISPLLIDPNDGPVEAEKEKEKEKGSDE